MTLKRDVEDKPEQIGPPSHRPEFSIGQGFLPWLSALTVKSRLPHLLALLCGLGLESLNSCLKDKQTHS